MALIPKHYLNCVVAVGVRKDDQRISWVGTGFLVAQRVEGASFNVFLVTNKHVLEGERAVVVRFNPQDGEVGKDYELTLVDEQGARYWVEHRNPEVDVAAVWLGANLLHSQGVKFDCFATDRHFLTVAQMAERGISEGDFVYVLGYPMAIVDPQRQYAIVRSGSIARIRDLLGGYSGDLLVDVLIFPGNSGGPVILRPEIAAIDGTPAVNTAFVIGLVKHSISYTERAISEQTKRPRVVFEDNSGLAAIVPADAILDVVPVCLERQQVVPCVPLPGPPPADNRAS